MSKIESKKSSQNATGPREEGGDEGMTRWGKVNDGVSTIETLQAKTVHCTHGFIYKQAAPWAVRQ